MDDVVHFVVVVGGVDPGRLWGAIGCVAWPSRAPQEPPPPVMPARTNPKIHCHDILSGISIFFPLAVVKFSAHLATT